MDSIACSCKHPSGQGTQESDWREVPGNAVLWLSIVLRLYHWRDLSRCNRSVRHNGNGRGMLLQALGDIMFVTGIDRFNRD